MAHAVETMAYFKAEAASDKPAFGNQSGVVPWHGLGVPVAKDLSAQEMLVAAGLDWTVSCRPLHVQNPDGTFSEIAERQALVRDSDNKFFDVSSKAWKPVQNSDAFKFFHEFVAAGDAHMETAGSLNGGQVVFGMANLNCDHVLSDGDRITSYLLLANSHKVGQAFTIKPTATRVVCANTLQMALGGQWGSTNTADAKDTFKMTHYRDFDNAAMDEAREVIGLARDQFGKLAKLANQLKKVGLDRATVLSILSPLYAEKIKPADVIADFDKNATPTLKKVIESLTRAPGAEPDTAWGLLNAVTHYEDHVSGRSPGSRLSSSWLGAGGFRKSAALAKVAALV